MVDVVIKVYFRTRICPYQSSELLETEKQYKIWGTFSGNVSVAGGRVSKSSGMEKSVKRFERHSKSQCIFGRPVPLTLGTSQVGSCPEEASSLLSWNLKGDRRSSASWSSTCLSEALMHMT